MPDAGFLVAKKPTDRFLSTMTPADSFLSDFKTSRHERESVKLFSYKIYEPQSCDKVCGCDHALIFWPPFLKPWLHP